MLKLDRGGNGMGTFKRPLEFFKGNLLVSWEGLVVVGGGGDGFTFVGFSCFGSREERKNGFRF